MFAPLSIIAFNDPTENERVIYCVFIEELKKYSRRTYLVILIDGYRVNCVMQPYPASSFYELTDNASHCIRFIRQLTLEEALTSEDMAIRKAGTLFSMGSKQCSSAN